MTLLRSALFNAWFYGLTFLVVVLAGIPVLLFAPGRALDIARIWARMVLAGLGPICGIRVVVTGEEYLPRGPALIASQHQSAFDTLVWFALVPRASYVMKRELARIPLFGGLNRASGMILVNRAGGTSALRQVMRDVDVALEVGKQVVIFPEGTRVAPGESVPLQPGIAALAARSKVAIIPVATDSGTCWGKRAFRKRPGIIHVRLLPPIPPGLPRGEMIDRLTTAWRQANAA